MKSDKWWTSQGGEVEWAIIKSGDTWGDLEFLIPLTPMSDQERVSLNNNNILIKYQADSWWE